MQDSQGQILALAFRFKSLKPFKLIPLRSEGLFWAHFKPKMTHHLVVETYLTFRVNPKKRRPLNPSVNLIPKPQTLNPVPQTFNPLRVPSPKPETVNPEPEP